MDNFAVNAERTPGARSAYLRTGEILDGKYRIERTLAEGGCGVVVLATQLQLDRPVAIKYLRPDALINAQLVALFEREARLAAQLRSDHVVGVHDVGVNDVIGPYLVMEFLEGSDLQSVLDQGTLQVHEAVDYILQACEALAEAHDLDIVHRDLKPANLFLASGVRSTPVLKVIDFGIAKTVAKRAAADGDQGAAGTPGYMSPEQLCGGSVDARSDIWALGVVLYELLSNRMPWGEGTIAEQIEAIRANALTPLGAQRHDAPPALEDVVLTCLQPDPEKRFQSVRELAAALRALEVAEALDVPLPLVKRLDSRPDAPTMAAPPEPRAMPRRARVAGTIAAVAAFGFALFALPAFTAPAPAGATEKAADVVVARGSTTNEHALVTARLALRDAQPEREPRRVVIGPQPATSPPPVKVPSTTKAPVAPTSPVTPTKLDRRSLFGETRL